MSVSKGGYERSSEETRYVVSPRPVLLEETNPEVPSFSTANSTRSRSLTCPKTFTFRTRTTSRRRCSATSPARASLPHPRPARRSTPSSFTGSRTSTCGTTRCSSRRLTSRRRCPKRVEAGSRRWVRTGVGGERGCCLSSMGLWIKRVGPSLHLIVNLRSKSDYGVSLRRSFRTVHRWEDGVHHAHRSSESLLCGGEVPQARS